MDVTSARVLADSLAVHMGYPVATVEPIPRPEDICCGDPSNLDGNAHPWSELGDDEHGTHYMCRICGATDTD